MKRHLILAALLTIGAANLNAASPKKTAPEQKGVETINRATAEAHIEFLACDELEGREAGWNGCAVKLSGRLSNHPEQYLFWDGKSNVWIWAVYVDDRRRHGYLDFPEKCG